jgi:rhamnogalacturonan endolyase
MNTKESYYGGPLHSDLTVDGVVYNYMVSNHHGDQVPNITNGYDRTFGPQYFHFNKFPAGSSISALRADAAQYADPTWNAPFYDSIAPFVPNLATSSQRATWQLHVDLPANAANAIAVLSANGLDFQDNVYDPAALQYWAAIDPVSGTAAIPRVKAGVYRLTIYADGIFGQYVQDDVVVAADGKTHTTHARWREESAGTELFRIGTPDKSSGEYRHGYARDAKHSLHPEEYRVYWAVYDYPTDFPQGVTFRVGQSDVSRDMNYVHWSVFGGYANSVRKTPYYGNGDVNNWTVVFDVAREQVERKRTATFTVQLAGAKTAAGNTDVFNSSEPFANLPYTVGVNGRDLEAWVIP